MCQQNATPVLQHNLKRKGVQPLWDNHSYCQAGAPCQCYTLHRKWVRTTNDPPAQLLVPACCIKCKPAVQTVWFMMALTFNKKPLEDWMASIFSKFIIYLLYIYYILYYLELKTGNDFNGKLLASQTMCKFTQKASVPFNPESKHITITFTKSLK